MKQIPSWIEFEGKFKIEKLGLVRANNCHPARSHAPFWVLVLMNKGSRTLSLNGQEIRAGMRDFFLLPPNTDQQPLEIDAHIACYVHFYAKSKWVGVPDRIDATRLALPLFGSLPPEVDCFAHLRFLCDHAASPYARDTFLSSQISALLSLISLHAQKEVHAAPTKSQRTAEEILAFIKEHLHLHLRAEDYEAAFQLSYHQINRIFKRKFGHTPKQYHLHARMEEAASLLRLGKTISETALACGFDDYFFFIRSFSRAYGIPPASYQKQWSLP